MRISSAMWLACTVLAAAVVLLIARSIQNASALAAARSIPASPNHAADRLAAAADPHAPAPSTQKAGDEESVERTPTHNAPVEPSPARDASAARGLGGAPPIAAGVGPPAARASPGPSTATPIHWAGDELERGAERLREIDRYLESDPGNPAALRDAAQLAQRLGRVTETVDYLKRLLTAAPDDDEARFLLASAWLDQGLFLSAAEQLRVLVAHRPEDGRVWFNLATACRGAGLADEALHAFGQALRCMPDQLEALRGRAEARLVLGRFEEAIADWQTLVDRGEMDAAARLNLALAQGAAGRTADALATLRAARAEHPRNVAVLNRLAALAWREAQARQPLDAALAQEAGDCLQASLAIDASQEDVRAQLAVVQAADARP